MKSIRSVGPGFARLWVSETASLAGSQVTLFALPLVAAVTLDVSAWEMGVLAASGSAANLVFGLSAGVMADRFERIRLMQVCNVLRLAVIGSIPLLYAVDYVSVPVMCVAAFAVGALTLVYDSAKAAVVPRLVERGSLTTANSWMQGSVAAADVAGPGLAGVLVQILGAPLALLADAASYLIGVIFLQGTPRVPPEREEHSEGHFSAIRRGFSYLWRDSVQRPLALAAGHYNVFHAMFFAVFTLFALRELHLTPLQLGIAGTCTGIAGILAVSASTWIADRLGYGRVMVAVYALPGAIAVVIPMLPAGNQWLSLVVVSVCEFLWTIVVVVNLVVSESIKQVRTPDPLLGRVTSSLRFLSSGADPIGALLGGALASTLLGLRGTLVLASVGLVTSTLWPLSRQVRRIRTLDDLELGQSPPKAEAGAA
ncbi:MFS transporter [Streptomyces sp. NBC_00287]|uniref:MFS transporter n=1 Tax=Streptomyces sp. NBC_00287 TaxID=2975702 RepID=UPI002E289B6B|nr:MFS transporter [Streptomyces sp. NBC_00287]